MLHMAVQSVFCSPMHVGGAPGWLASAGAEPGGVAALTSAGHSHVSRTSTSPLASSSARSSFLTSSCMHIILLTSSSQEGGLHHSAVSDWGLNECLTPLPCTYGMQVHMKPSCLLLRSPGAATEKQVNGMWR